MGAGAVGASAVGASAVNAVVANIDGFYAWLVPVQAGQFGRTSVLDRQCDTTGLGVVAGGIDHNQLDGVDAIGEAYTVQTAQQATHNLALPAIEVNVSFAGAAARCKLKFVVAELIVLCGAHNRH